MFIRLSQIQLTTTGSGLPIENIAIQPRPSSPEETDGGSGSGDIASHISIARPDVQFISKTTFVILYIAVSEMISMSKRAPNSPADPQTPAY